MIHTFWGNPIPVAQWGLELLVTRSLPTRGPGCAAPPLARDSFASRASRGSLGRGQKQGTPQNGVSCGFPSFPSLKRVQYPKKACPRKSMVSIFALFGMVSLNWMVCFLLPFEFPRKTGSDSHFEQLPFLASQYFLSSRTFFIFRESHIFQPSGTLGSNPLK